MRDEPLRLARHNEMKEAVMPHDPVEGTSPVEPPRATRHRADVSGQVFEHLTVIRRVEDQVTPSGKRHAQYLCQCDCGAQKRVRGDNLTGFRTTSCGHMQGKATRESKAGDGQYVPADYGTGRLVREAQERRRRLNGLR